MHKIKRHLQENYILYLLLLLSLIVVLAVKLIPRTKTVELDTSMFTIVNTKESLELFEKSTEKAQVLLIGRKDCSACIAFEPTLKIAIATTHFYLHYLELEEIDENTEEGKSLLEKLDYEYTMEDTTKPFSAYLGMTPMLIIIKNKKMIYGHIGKMELEKLTSVIKKYNANYQE